MSSAVDRRRHARHLTLPGVGEEGQRRLGAATVELRGGGLRGWVARRYLEAAGVGRVHGAEGAEEAREAPVPWEAVGSEEVGTPREAVGTQPAEIVGAPWVEGELRVAASREVTAGALEALGLLRGVLRP
jgi:hypothetical protein